MSKLNGQSSRVIVVTGATGFVGRHVVERLLQTAESEDLIIRCMLRHLSDEKSFSEHPRLEFIYGDINASESLNVAVKGAWGVVNIAGLREFWTKDRKAFYRLNHIGAKKVFEACLRQNIDKVVQVSTPLSFGVPATIPFNESTPAGDHPSDYARSKYLGDQEGIRLMKEEKLPLTIVYLAAVIGAGDDKETMEVRRAVEGNMPALVGANTTYTYLYVKDAAEAIVRSLLLKESVGQQYLIGKERATTREYFNIIGSIANVKIPSINLPEKMLIPVAKVMEGVSKFSGIRPELPLDVIKTTAAGSLLFDVNRSEQELHMTYTPLPDALAEAVEYVRQH